MRDKRDTYTNDGGGYSKPRVTQNKKRAMQNAVTGALGSYVMSSAKKAWVDKLTPTYQTEKSLASRPQTDQINSRRYRAKSHKTCVSMLLKSTQRERHPIGKAPTVTVASRELL